MLVADAWKVFLEGARQMSLDWELGALWVTALLTLLLFLRAFELSKFDKRADVLMHSNDRYDDLLKDFAALKDGRDINLERRYWAIFGDNFEYYLLGYLDVYSISAWVCAAHTFAQRGEQPFGFDIRDSWQRSGRVRQGDNVLAIVMTEIVLNREPLDIEDVRKKIRRLYNHPVAKKRRAGVRSA